MFVVQGEQLIKNQGNCFKLCIFKMLPKHTTIYLLYLHRLASFCTYTELLEIYIKHRTIKDCFGHALWFSTITGNSEIMPAPLQPTEHTKNHKTFFSIPYKKVKEMQHSRPKCMEVSMPWDKTRRGWGYHQCFSCPEILTPPQIIGF